MSCCKATQRIAGVWCSGSQAFGEDGIPLPRNATDLARFGPMYAEVMEEQCASRAAVGLWLQPCERWAGRFGMAEHLPRIGAPCLALNAAEGHYI